MRAARVILSSVSRVEPSAMPRVNSLLALLHGAATARAWMRDIENGVCLPPLHVAAWQGNTSGILHFIDAGTRINLRAPPCGDGMTALHVATVAERESVVRLLLRLGANPTLRTFVRCRHWTQYLTGEHTLFEKPYSKRMLGKTRKCWTACPLRIGACTARDLVRGRSHKAMDDLLTAAVKSRRPPWAHWLERIEDQLSGKQKRTDLSRPFTRSSR